MAMKKKDNGSHMLDYKVRRDGGHCSAVGIECPGLPECCCQMAGESLPVAAGGGGGGGGCGLACATLRASVHCNLMLLLGGCLHTPAPSTHARWHIPSSLLPFCAVAQPGAVLFAASG